MRRKYTDPLDPNIDDQIKASEQRIQLAGLGCILVAAIMAIFWGAFAYAWMQKGQTTIKIESEECAE